MKKYFISLLLLVGFIGNISAVQVSVIPPSGGTYEINVESDTTVGKLKEIIKDTFPSIRIPAHLQLIKVESPQDKDGKKVLLDDGATMSELGVEGGSRFYVEQMPLSRPAPLPPRGSEVGLDKEEEEGPALRQGRFGFNLKFSDKEGHTYMFMHPGETVKVLKDYIVNIKQVSPDMVSLTFDGKELDDSQLFGSVEGLQGAEDPIVHVEIRRDPESQSEIGTVDVDEGEGDGEEGPPVSRPRSVEAGEEELVPSRFTQRQKIGAATIAALTAAAVATGIKIRSYRKLKTSLIKKYNLGSLTPLQNRVWLATALASYYIPWYLRRIVSTTKGTLDNFVGADPRAVAELYYGHVPSQKELNAFVEKFFGGVKR